MAGERQRAEESYNLGLQHLQDKDHYLALTLFEEAIGSDIHYIPPYFKKAELCLQISEFSKGIETITQLINICRRDLSLKDQLVKAYILQATLQASSATLNPVLNFRTTHIEALKTLLEVRKLDNNSQVNYLMGISYYAIGEFSHARNAFKKAADLKHPNPNISFHLQILDKLAEDKPNYSRLANAEQEMIKAQEAQALFAEQHFKPLNQKHNDALNQIERLTKQTETLEKEKGEVQTQLNKSKSEANELRNKLVATETEAAQLRAALAQAQRPVNIAITAPRSESPSIPQASLPSQTSSQGLFSSLFSRTSAPAPTQIQQDGVIVSFSNSAGST